MGLEDERKMLTGSGDPKEEEEEELVVRVTSSLELFYKNWKVELY